MITFDAFGGFVCSFFIKAKTKMTLWNQIEIISIFLPFSLQNQKQVSFLDLYKNNLSVYTLLISSGIFINSYMKKFIDSQIPPQKLPVHLLFIIEAYILKVFTMF